jgi:hypothetical protein
MPADLGHRLAHCVGYTVFDVDAGTGVIVDLEFDPTSTEPTHVVVQRGLIRRTRARVPIDHVVDVDDDRRRVTTSAPSGTGATAWRHVAAR